MSYHNYAGRADMRKSIINSKGLTNAVGENNCFLNSAVQVLWHLDVFRQNFRLLVNHACVGRSCVFCGLKVIFTQFEFGDDSSLQPIALRTALAKAFEAKQRFQMGAMDDAAECFENLLLRLHFHVAHEHSEDKCNEQHCLTHQKFAMKVTEQLRCDCGARSSPMSFVQLVHYITTHSLIDQSANRSLNFGRRLRYAFSHGEIVKSCPVKCGKNATMYRSLTNSPDVVSIGLIWNSDSPSVSHIKDFVTTIDTSLRLGDLFECAESSSMVLELVGVVCYYGKHYSTFFFHSRRHTWVSFDDESVTEIAPEWDKVVEKVCRGHYQPLLLLYQNPTAFHISVATAMKETVQLPQYFPSSSSASSSTHSVQSSSSQMDANRNNNASNPRGCTTDRKAMDPCPPLPPRIARQPYQRAPTTPYAPSPALNHNANSNVSVSRTPLPFPQQPTVCSSVEVLRHACTSYNPRWQDSLLETCSGSVIRHTVPPLIPLAVAPIRLAPSPGVPPAYYAGAAQMPQCNQQLLPNSIQMPAFNNQHILPTTVGCSGNNLIVTPEGFDPFGPLLGTPICDNTCGPPLVPRATSEQATAGQVSQLMNRVPMTVPCHVPADVAPTYFNPAPQSQQFNPVQPTVATQLGVPTLQRVNPVRPPTVVKRPVSWVPSDSIMQPVPLSQSLLPSTQSSQASPFQVGGPCINSGLPLHQSPYTNQAFQSTGMTPQNINGVPVFTGVPAILCPTLPPSLPPRFMSPYSNARHQCPTTFTDVSPTASAAAAGEPGHGIATSCSDSVTVDNLSKADNLMTMCDTKEKGKDFHAALLCCNQALLLYQQAMKHIESSSILYSELEIIQCKKDFATTESRRIHSAIQTQYEAARDAKRIVKSSSTESLPLNAPQLSDAKLPVDLPSISDLCLAPTTISDSNLIQLDETVPSVRQQMLKEQLIDLYSRPMRMNAVRNNGLSPGTRPQSCVVGYLQQRGCVPHSGTPTVTSGTSNASLSAPDTPMNTL